MLGRLSLQTWDRKGQHETRGPVSVRKVVAGLLEHEEEHCEQIEALALQKGKLR